MLKTILGAALVAAISTAATPVAAANFVLSGDTTGGPTYNRVNANGNNTPTALSAVGTAVAYNSLLFAADVSGNYTFLLTSTETGYDPFLSLYSGVFSAASPLSNVLVANDDLTGLTTSGFSRFLTAGQVYTAVVTGYNNADFGTYTLAITSAIPEPTSWALMIGGMGLAGGMMRRRVSKVTYATA